MENQMFDPLNRIVEIKIQTWIAAWLIIVSCL